MGGAVEFRKNKRKWAFILSNVVNGSVKNVFSKQDRLLHLYSLCEISVAAGRNEIVILEDENDPNSNLVSNFDISKNVISSQQSGVGHLNYMKEPVLKELFLNIGLQ